MRSDASSGSDADVMRAYYAARAAEYDRVYDKPERQQDLRAIERWLPSVFGSKSILEVACGTGYWTRFLAPVAARITAVDASIETLNIANARVAAPHVQFIVGDAYRLPVAPLAFDAGFAGFWFSHVPRARVAAFLRGFHGAMASGAKVVLLDNRYVDGSSTPIAEHDAEGNTYQMRRLDDGSKHRVLKNFPSEEELRHAFAGVARELRLHEWQHFWALEYRVA
jgi:demethylmenaquinone methyltransferase/2-methoxy-6-polyprenyl-1,4-benzoquinol methylase